MVSAPICWHCVLNQPVHPSTQRLHTPDRSPSDSFFTPVTKRCLQNMNAHSASTKPPPTPAYSFPVTHKATRMSLCPPISFFPLFNPKSRLYWSTCCLLTMPSFLFDLSPSSQTFILPSSFSPQYRHHLLQDTFPSTQTVPWRPGHWLLLEHLKQHFTIIC